MITADFEFTISSKNKETLVVEGHEFYAKRLNKFTTAWNCSKYQSYKCRVSALTQDDQLIRVNGEHNHSAFRVAGFSKPATRKVIKEIKGLSENLTPTAAVASAILPVTDVHSTQYALPSKPNLIQTSQRLRKVIQTVSIHEKSDRHFDIPEFLLYDSGKHDRERILVFGVPSMKTVLESSKFWLGDGGFKLSPKNVYQIYSLHVYVLGIAPACLYAVLPKKTEKTYNRLLDALGTFAPDCKPDKILLDFEIASINAVEGWHYGIQALFSGSHPGIRKL